MNNILMLTGGLPFLVLMTPSIAGIAAGGTLCALELSLGTLFAFAQSRTVCKLAYVTVHTAELPSTRLVSALHADCARRAFSIIRWQIVAQLTRCTLYALRSAR